VKNDTDTCVQCGKPMVGGGMSDEQREAVAEAARFAAGEGE
jgi:hypothetical protein